MHRFLVIVLSATALLIAGLAEAPQKSEPLKDNQIMKYENSKDFIVSARVFLYPDSGLIGRDQFAGWTYTDFTLVMPYVTESGTSWLTSSTETSVIAAIALNGAPANLDTIPTRTVPGTSASYATLNVPGTVSFSAAEAMIAVKVTAVETEFDDEAAWNLPWAEAGSLGGWLQRDAVYDQPLKDGTDPIQMMLDRWTEGNDPKQIPPVQLAKYLTANVLDHMRATGSNRRTPLGRSASSLVWRINDDDGTFSGATVRTPQNLVGGFVVQNAGNAIQAKAGSEHDLANVLTAVFRCAGLPARTVIGVDNLNTGDDEVKSWVEFAIRAPDVDEPIWVPVDVWELESDGRSTRNWEQPWKHFGSTDELRNVPPIAYHFHPPANYRSYSLPALFGIQSDAELPDFGVQAVDFEVNGAPKRGGQPRP